MKLLLNCSMLAAFVISLAGPTLAAQTGKKESCAVVADRYARNEQRKLILKTALMGGTSAIFIGAAMSEFNKDGKQKANGLFGGGQIGGKGAKLRMKQNHAKAMAACKAGRKI
jgi:hypothetical protein